VVIDIDLMEMCRSAGEHAPHIRVGEHTDVAERIDALDLQLTHRLDASASVGAVGVRLELSLEPVDRRVAVLAGALGRAGVF